MLPLQRAQFLITGWGTKIPACPAAHQNKNKNTHQNATAIISQFLSVHESEFSWVPLPQGRSQTFSQGVSQGRRHVKAYRTTKYIKKKKMMKNPADPTCGYTL